VKPARDWYVNSDFGIARYFKPALRKDTLLLGTTGYASPAQFGWAQTTPRSDIYSLGAILYQLVTGDDPTRIPFHFAPLHPGKHAIPANLAQLIMHLIDLNEGKSPGSAVLVMKELQEIARAFEKHPLTSLDRSIPVSY
jgi:serine/threonine protein kinase